MGRRGDALRYLVAEAERLGDQVDRGDPVDVDVLRVIVSAWRELPPLVRHDVAQLLSRPAEVLLLVSLDVTRPADRLDALIVDLADARHRPVTRSAAA